MALAYNLVRREMSRIAEEAGFHRRGQVR